MAIADDIAAARANEAKPEAERERDVRKIKCQSMYETLFAIRRQQFTFAQRDWTLWDVWLEDDGAVLALTFRCVGRGALAGTIYMRPQIVHRFSNPPPLAADGSDNRIQAAKEMLNGVMVALGL